MPLAVATGVTVGGFAIAVFAAIFNPNPIVGRELRLTDVSASFDPLRGTVEVSARF